MKALRRWLCRRVLGHQWGKEPGRGATCTRCGLLSAPWDDLAGMGWQLAPGKRVRVTATLTDAQDGNVEECLAWAKSGKPTTALRESARPRAPLERIVWAEEVAVAVRDPESIREGVGGDWSLDNE